MYRHKYKRRDDDAKKLNQSQSETLVKLYIEMNIDSNGDSKIKYDHNLKYESKIKTDPRDNATCKTRKGYA